MTCSARQKGQQAEIKFQLQVLRKMPKYLRDFVDKTEKLRNSKKESFKVLKI